MSNEINKVLFDANVFIDLVKYGGSAEKPKDAQRAKHVEAAEAMLRAARAGDLVIVASALCIAECTGIKNENDATIVTDEVKQLFNALFLSNMSGITLRQPDPLLLREARDLTWTHGMSIAGADAIHVATCKKMGCAAMITFDGRITKKAASKAALKKLGIRLCKAHEAMNLLPDEYKQEEFSSKVDTQFVKPQKKPKARKSKSRRMPRLR